MKKNMKIIAIVIGTLVIASLTLPLLATRITLNLYKKPEEYKQLKAMNGV